MREVPVVILSQAKVKLILPFCSTICRARWEHVDHENRYQHDSQPIPSIDATCHRCGARLHDMSSKPRLLGWQIVKSMTDELPLHMRTYNGQTKVYSLMYALAWMLQQDARDEWRLLPIYEGDVTEPVFNFEETPGMGV